MSNTQRNRGTTVNKTLTLIGIVMGTVGACTEGPVGYLVVIASTVVITLGLNWESK